MINTQKYIKLHTYPKQKSAVSNLHRVCPGQRSEPLFTDWCWWILGGLPFPHLVRVMDCYFHEGIKVFYRIALAILILFNKHAVSSLTSDKSNTTNGGGSTIDTKSAAGNGSSTTGSSADWTMSGAGAAIDKADMENALPKFCRNLPVSPTKLLRTAFSIRALR